MRAVAILSRRALAAGSRLDHEARSEHGIPIRLGAVEYLNTKPLICDLEKIASNIELVLEVPSKLADMLRARELDVALIPVVEYFRAGSYSQTWQARIPAPPNQTNLLPGCTARGSN